jgi:hypothetical protein
LEPDNGGIRQVAGSIPETYDTYLVPLIFESYAADLADRVAVLKPRSVLETAAASGVVTRALAPALTADARYAVTDLNQGNPPTRELSGNNRRVDIAVPWAIV